MKRIIQTLIIISLFCGCQDRLPSMSLELSESVIECSNSGGEFEIGISGRPDWTTDNTAEWISVRKTAEGAVIIIDSNHGADRSRTVSFKLDGKSLAGIDIHQAHSNEFSVEKNDFTIGYKGGSITAVITCFDIWEASSDSKWIELDKTEGIGPHELVIDIALNTSEEARSGKVTISNKDTSLSINILQALSPIVEVESEEVRFDGDGGQKDVLYMSNTDVKITCADPWIRLIDHGSSTRKVSFEVLRNSGGTRQGCIRIESAEDSEIFKDIVISQGPKIDHPALSFEEGTYLALSSKDPVQLHPVFTDMSDFTLQWSSSDPQIATVEKSGIVTILTGGTCVITAMNPYHGVEASITLNIMPMATEMYVMFGTQDMNENPIAVRFPGENLEITVTMNPADAYCGDVTYFSTDDSVATIIGNMIHCLKPGAADIYVESVYQSIRQKYTIFVAE